MVDMTNQDLEQQVRKLKRFLEGWRMALLPLKSIILWEQQWHPCAIIGSLTFLYLLIWLLDLSTLATLAVVGLIFNFIDFIVPVICNSLYGPSSWNGQKEKVFEETCRNIVIHYNNITNKVKSFYYMRDTSPFMYYIISISLLICMAWLASSINNIFLLYLVSVLMLLWPGIQQHGLFNAMLSLINKSPKTLKSE